MARRTSAPGFRRDGQSMLEVVAAMALLALTLVPALRLMRDAIAVSQQIADRAMMTTFCISKLEEALALTAADWQTSTLSGNFGGQGYSYLKYNVVRSDSPAAGGISDRLLAVTATVWNDADGNSLLGSGELSVVLASKVAKMALYQNEAAP